MLRVGQPGIAWNAFSRASVLAGSAWPAPRIQDAFRSHCAARLRLLEEALAQKREDPPTTFEDELAFGLAYQGDRQRYEQERIAAGASIDDKGFYDAFDQARGAIASPVGAEEWYAYLQRERRSRYGWRQGLLIGLFGAGLAAMATALLLRLVQAATRSRAGSLDGERTDSV